MQRCIHVCACQPPCHELCSTRPKKTWRANLFQYPWPNGQRSRIAEGSHWRLSSVPRATHGRCLLSRKWPVLTKLLSFMAWDSTKLFPLARPRFSKLKTWLRKANPKFMRRINLSWIHSIWAFHLKKMRQVHLFHKLKRTPGSNE